MWERRVVILQRDSKRVALHFFIYHKALTLMTTQSINDQLELLRLKELFMSDIDLRSKMAMLICREEDPTYGEFCQLTNCTPNIAKMFAQLLVIDVMLTPEEIAAERERLEKLKS